LIIHFISAHRFQQDDAHIFCAANQIEQEVFSCLEFLQHVYGIFGFEFSLELSTRPENYLGEINTWDNAENQLKVVLDKFGRPWKLNPGDGTHPYRVVPSYIMKRF
jgi:threonyl-tRNA synthetase